LSAARTTSDAAGALSVHEDRIPGAKLVLIPRAGHFVMMENPEDFNKAVREFVEKV
jgi:pimeloyl-ACP methyl ester carboxylesterase